MILQLPPRSADTRGNAYSAEHTADLEVDRLGAARHKGVSLRSYLHLMSDAEPKWGDPTPVELPLTAEELAVAERGAGEEAEGEDGRPRRIQLWRQTVLFSGATDQDEVLMTFYCDNIVHLAFTYQNSEDDIRMSLCFPSREDGLQFVMDALSFFDGLVVHCHRRWIGLMDYAAVYLRKNRGRADETYADYLATAVCEEILRAEIATPGFDLADTDNEYRWRRS